MTLRGLPKPEEFDLHLARANRDNDSSKWLPEDVLYDASVAMQKDVPCTAVVVIWYTRLPNGNLALKFRVHQEHDRQGVALLTDTLAELTSP